MAQKESQHWWLLCVVGQHLPNSIRIGLVSLPPQLYNSIVFKIVVLNYKQKFVKNCNRLTEMAWKFAEIFPESAAKQASSSWLLFSWFLSPLICGTVLLLSMWEEMIGDRDVSFLIINWTKFCFFSLFNFAAFVNKTYKNTTNTRWVKIYLTSL